MAVVVTSRSIDLGQAAVKKLSELPSECHCPQALLAMQCCNPQ
jgi:hypothetical protein